MEFNYKNKYLKYKNKYLNIKTNNIKHQTDNINIPFKVSSILEDLFEPDMIKQINQIVSLDRLNYIIKNKQNKKQIKKQIMIDFNYELDTIKKNNLQIKYKNNINNIVNFYKNILESEPEQFELLKKYLRLSINDNFYKWYFGDKYDSNPNLSGYNSVGDVYSDIYDLIINYSENITKIKSQIKNFLFEISRAEDKYIKRTKFVSEILKHLNQILQI